MANKQVFVVTPQQGRLWLSRHFGVVWCAVTQETTMALLVLFPHSCNCEGVHTGIRTSCCHAEDARLQVPKLIQHRELAN